MSKCKDCIYFKPLVKTKESWGECLWFEHMLVSIETINLPNWSYKVIRDSGAINPEHSGCNVFDEGE